MGNPAFLLQLKKNNKLKAGWEVLVTFCIALHKKDLVLLESIKSFLGVGNITNGGKDMIQFRVRVLKDLTAVINHFDKYPLITQKFADYQLFKQVVDLKNCKEHFTSEGLQKIVNLKASMNWGLSSELKAAFPDTIPVQRPLVSSEKINSDWLAGFVAAESSFFINIRKSLSCSLGESVTLRFQIVQHTRDAL